jgi:hypothetical protein
VPDEEKEGMVRREIFHGRRRGREGIRHPHGAERAEEPEFRREAEAGMVTGTFSVGERSVSHVWSVSGFRAASTAERPYVASGRMKTMERSPVE